MYTWDIRGRLKTVAMPNGETVNYNYDALGRRTSRTSSNQTTNFVYDGQDVVQDKQGSNNVNYLNGLGIDDKLKVDNKYFLKDHLGSTIGLTNTSGSLVESQKYEAFGKATGSLSTRYGFTGREYDADTKLNYYRARWYDLEQGRFISSDPIGFQAGENFYSYVGNSPFNGTDPFGLWVQILFYRNGGTNGGGRLVVYDMDKPRQVWVPNNSGDVNQPAGNYETQYEKIFELNDGLFSGYGSCENKTECETDANAGPIPKGDYGVFDDFKPGRGWYQLWKKQSDGNYKDRGPVGNGVERGEFRLHAGNISIGCVTFKGLGNSEFSKLSKLIKGSSTIRIPTPEGMKTGRGFMYVY
jgi:RHS repeat-associated protein